MKPVPHISSPPTLAEANKVTAWWREECTRVRERPKHGRSMLGITRSEMDAILHGKSKVNLEWRINIALLVALIVGGTIQSVRISDQVGNIAKQTIIHTGEIKTIVKDTTSMKVQIDNHAEEIRRLRDILDKQG